MLQWINIEPDFFSVLQEVDLIIQIILNDQFFLYYHIFGKRAYPSRSSQGIFASSSIQTPVS